MAVIEIYVDQVWAGSGKLVRCNDECRIEDCGAQFCDDNDASLKVYDSIEEAIEAGKESITVELDGESKKITWTVTESGDEDETEAQQLIAEYPNAADLMTILDTAAYPSDQDWSLGQTTWTLNDGSKIRICGNDVEALTDEGDDEDDSEPTVAEILPAESDRCFSFDATDDTARIRIETKAGWCEVVAKLIVEFDEQGDCFLNAAYVSHDGDATDMEIAYALRAIEANDLGVTGDFS